MPWQNGEFVYSSQVNDSKSGVVEHEETKAGERAFDGDFEKPRENEYPESALGIPGNINTEQARDIKENQIFKRIKNSSEVLSLMGAVVDDIIGSEEPSFTYVGRTDNAENPGKRNIRQAKEFWRDNKELIGDSIMDALAVGDGYLYKIGKDEEQLKNTAIEYIDENYDFNSLKYKEAAADMIVSKADALGSNQTEDLDLVPASTVEHDIDEFGNIQRYVQNIGSNEYDLDPEKVIHHSYLNLNGKTYGLTPLAASFAELDMLANAKDYNGVKFDNAAVPNKVFKLKEDGPNSQNFDMVKETVKKYRQLQNKHRDLVLTGDIEIDDLNDTSDVEFKELIKLVTRILAMAWGVPPSRVGGIVGGQGATESAMASEGYSKRIGRQQDKYESILNNELFEPMFSVRISLPNPHVKTEIRKAERDMRKTNVVIRQAAIGMMPMDEAKEYLGKTNQEIYGDLSDEQFIELAQNMAQSQKGELSDREVDRAQGEEAVDQQQTPNRNGGDDATVENQ